MPSTFRAPRPRFLLMAFLACGLLLLAPAVAQSTVQFCDSSGVPSRADRAGGGGVGRVAADITTRDGHEGGFTMTVGGRIYAGPGAREEAGRALIESVLSPSGNPAMIQHASFRGL